MRLIEIRLLEGPNVHRLDPTVKVEVAVGRTRAWRGERLPEGRVAVRLGRPVPSRDWPDPVADVVAWTRRLRGDHDEADGPTTVHRASDPGHWVVAWPWRGAERARLIAEASVDLATRDVSPRRGARLTGTQVRMLGRWAGRIGDARATPPTWITDAERRIPIVSITGTNGKSTVTRLITHILARAGRRVGTTTSDGILVDERLIEAGDWTGPGGAAQVLRRTDVDVAVLETARGGIVLRGIGYASNEASVFTNVSSDHLDVQGIHTLPELAEVKATVCRITRPGGWVVLNADDPLVAAVARRVRAQVALFSLDPDTSEPVRRHRGRGGRAYGLRRGQLLEFDGVMEREIAHVSELPVTLGGLARHNVANALAAAGGARALGATLAQVGEGLRDFEPSSDRSPGRLNLFRYGAQTVIVDFAHNEAGVRAILDVAEALAGGAAGRTAPITAIVGTAGDRPDDTLRGIGRIAAGTAQRVAIKETLRYLRGRDRAEVVEAIRDGVREAGVAGEVPVYASETAALEAELLGSARLGGGDGRPDPPRVVLLLCHEQREDVLTLLERLGAQAIDPRTDLADVAPRLADRHRER